MRSVKDINPDDIVLEMNVGFGPEVTTLWSVQVSVCEPCLKHDGRYRRAAFTGERSFDFTAPNLCNAHKESFDRGRDWDRPLGSVGRPRSEGGCLIEGCDGVVRSRGLCQRHYSKARRAAVR